MPRRLSDGAAISEAQRFKTLTLGRTVGGGGVGVALPQATAQNQMVIADATPAWSLLAAPSAQHQVPIAGVDPYTPAWSALTVAAISDLAYAAPGLTLSTANAEGAADTVIRTDATILVFDAAEPDDIRPDEAAAAGSAATAARRDHTHGIVCAVPASPSVSLSVSAEGSGTSFARADHAHQLDQAIAPTWTELHTFSAGITFDGETAKNIVTVPDNLAQAMHVVDAGGVEYLRIVSTDAQPVIVFNEGGADVDFRVEASGQANALFVQGSDGRRGMGTGDPAGQLHIVSIAAVTNIHRPAYGTPTLILDDGSVTAVTLQLAARDYSTRMCHIVMTGAPTTGNNKHWIVSHLGPVVNNRFSIGYLTSSATDFSTWADVDEYLTISTAGAVHIVENSATVRLSGTRSLHIVILEPIAETVGQIRIPWNCTVTRVDANVVGGTSCTFNLEEVATLGSAGTNVLSSDMVADANGESVTSGFNNASLAEGNHLAFDISAVSGDVDYVSITLTVTVD